MNGKDPLQVNVSAAEQRLFFACVAMLSAVIAFFSVWTLGSNVVTFSASPFSALYIVLTAALCGGGLGGVYSARLARALSRPDLAAPAIDLASIQMFDRRVFAISTACGFVIVAGFVGIVKFTAFWPLWLGALALAIVALFLPAAERRAAPISAAEDGRRDWLRLAGFALLVLAIYFFRNHPDGDDAFYLNLPIGMIESARGVMAFDTMLGGDWPLLMSTYRAESLPSLAAVLSTITGADVAYVAHAVLPFVWCLVFAATVYVIGRTFFGGAWLVFGLFWLALLLALDGTLQGYGVHGLVRLYHGKGPLICFVAPLIFFVTYVGLKTRARPLWGAAVLLQVSAVGFTANAIYIAPLTMGLVCAAHFFHPSARNRFWPVLFLSSAIYPIIVAGYLLLFDPPTSYEVVGAQTVAEDVWSIFPTKYSVGFFAAVLVGAAAAGAIESRWRLLSLFVAAILVFLLNPFIWPLFAEYVTGKLNYRLFWAIPAPMLLAAGAAVLWRGGSAPMKAVLVLVTVVLLVAPTSILHPGNGGRFEFSPRKVDKAVFEAAQEANRITDKGMRILAAPRIALWIAAQEGYRHPIAVRTDYLVIRERSAAPGALEDRRTLFAWVSGEGGPLTPERRNLLATLCVATVVIDAGKAQAAQLRQDLAGIGADAAGEAAGFEFYRIARDPVQCPALDL